MELSFFVIKGEKNLVSSYIKIMKRLKKYIISETLFLKTLLSSRELG